MSTPQIETLDGFQDGDADRIRAAIHRFWTEGKTAEEVDGEQIRHEYVRLTTQALDKFFDAGASADTDNAARYGVTALVTANVLTGIFGNSPGADMADYAVQERAAGEALRDVLDGASPSLRQTIEPMLREWERSPIAQSKVVGDAMKELGESAVSGTRKSGCLILLFMCITSSLVALVG